VLNPHWVFAGALLGLIGSVRYAVAIPKGSVRPNLVTWCLWALAPLIGFLAQLDSGVGLPALMTLAAGTGPLIVIMTSLVARRHYTHLGVVDVICAGIAGVALAAWIGLDEAPLAVFFAIAADGVAALPTLVKAWRRPSSESLFFYVLVGIGATITLFTISNWAPQAWAFAVYQLSICVIFVAVISTRRHGRRFALSQPT